MLFHYLQALASTLDEEEIADLRDQFSAIDVDKNGVISLEEMRQVLLIYRVEASFVLTTLNGHWQTLETSLFCVILMQKNCIYALIKNNCVCIWSSYFWWLTTFISNAGPCKGSPMENERITSSWDSSSGKLIYLVMKHQSRTWHLINNKIIITKYKTLLLP